MNAFPRDAPPSVASRPMAFFFTLTTRMEIYMKTALLAISLALSMTVLPPALGADEQDAHAEHHKPEATAAAHSGRGKVNSVNQEVETINLTHDPIKSLKWPRMTMDFKVNDPALLKELKPGDQVDFELAKMDGAYRIEPQAGGRALLTWTGVVEAESMPPLIGELLMRSNIEDQFRGMVREIERREILRREREARQ